MVTLIDDPTVFGDGITSAEAWHIANYLPVTPAWFADSTCEGDRVFGLVKEWCPRRECQHECEGELDPCVRNNLWRELFRITQETENLIGWTLTERFIEETVPWNGCDRITLCKGGVAELAVREASLPLIGYGPFTFSPSIGLASLIRDNVYPSGNTHREILLSRNLVDNPHKIMFFNNDRGQSGIPPMNAVARQIEWAQGRPNYPFIENYGGVPHWVLPLEGKMAAPGDEIVIVHCDYSILDVPTQPFCDGEIHPVYPGTTQKIPYIKTEILPSNWVRYYFKHHNMINPAFSNELIYLSRYEWWKFIETVEFRCFYTEPEPIEVLYHCTGECGGDCSGDPCAEGTDEDCPTGTAEACATLIDGDRGIIALEVTDDEIPPGVPYAVRIAYRTDPAELGYPCTSAIETLRRAIAARVAAEIILIDCGCESVEIGFFKDMRTELSTIITTAMGSTIVKLRYGDRKGEQYWHRMINQSPRFKQAALI